MREDWIESDASSHFPTRPSHKACAFPRKDLIDISRSSTALENSRDKEKDRVGRDDPDNIEDYFTRSATTLARSSWIENIVWADAKVRGRFRSGGDDKKRNWGMDE
jgi:hypothetical protein